MKSLLYLRREAWPEIWQKKSLLLR